MTLAEGKARAYKTFLIITYDYQNIFKVQATGSSIGTRNVLLLILSNNSTTTEVKKQISTYLEFL
jgi:hypothetical protein